MNTIPESGKRKPESRHLETRERATKRQRTGVPGISFFTTAANRRDGTVQSFFSVFTIAAGRRRNTRICLDTKGRAAAWAKALAIRAAYESQLSTLNSQLSTFPA
jgi:hypothetical protein